MVYRLICKLLLVLTSASIAGNACAQAAAPIRMLYYERKPFHYEAENGKIVGLTATPTEKVFAQANIPLKWDLIPVNRILAMIKGNEGAYCSPGWYKNPERASYARNSQPIYRDKPLVGLANKALKVRPGTTAKAFFARPDVRLITKQSFVLGAYLDAIVAKMPSSQIAVVTGEVPDIVRMIVADRADLGMITPEEIEFYVHQADLELKDFQVIKFPDVPGTEMRYIICSKAVPQETMDALNRAIAATVKFGK
jgi:polar amino acid transport system substrate-binding protein